MIKFTGRLGEKKNHACTCTRMSLFTVLDDNPVNEKCAGFHSRPCGRSQPAPVGGEVGRAERSSANVSITTREKKNMSQSPEMFPRKEDAAGR